MNAFFRDKASADPAYWEILPNIDHDAIARLRKERGAGFDNEIWRALAEKRERLDGLSTRHVDLSGPVVTLGQPEELAPAMADDFKAYLQEFMPWKKGPFNLFGEMIDAEWRSDLKWQRLLPYVGDLKDQVVADIGCHNGYFMFRMSALTPRMVIGFEPVLKHWCAFEWLNHLARRGELAFELLGVEHIDFYPKTFDTIFCLGILYHHTDPVGLVRKMRSSLKPGGRLFVDCQAIPGREPMALVPQSRYAGAKGVWFVPTASALKHWLVRGGFQKVEMIYDEPLSPDEQRATRWAPVPSLQDFLDPNDPSRTIEGYPAPRRIYMLAS